MSLTLRTKMIYYWLSIYSNLKIQINRLHLDFDHKEKRNTVVLFCGNRSIWIGNSKELDDDEIV